LLCVGTNMHAISRTDAMRNGMAFGREGLCSPGYFSKMDAERGGHEAWQKPAGMKLITRS